MAADGQNMQERDVVWSPGTKHPRYNVVADSDEGKWTPASGYKWADDPPVFGRVVWTPGLKHPDDNLVAGAEEGQWEPAPGYVRKSD